ncbi:MAG: Crp/Fnr family transcriptional regulator [Thermodesulfobacteriota bacterium]|nr:Crp/Fnr family transcriptional regulator [Thermodesulfobacteriota bacterium]
MKPDPDILKILKSSEFASGLKQEKLIDVLTQGRHARLESDDILFSQGDPAVSCHLVLKGRLKLTKLHEQGREAIVRYIDPGQLTAAIAVFKGSEYPVTALAVGRTEILSWNRKIMVHLMFKYPELAIKLLEVAVTRLDEIQTRYLELVAEQVDQRIARTLLRIMKHGGIKTSAGIEIPFPISRQEMADYAGTTLFTVSRTLSVWEKKGWIKSGREKITITNVHALVLFSEIG